MPTPALKGDDPRCIEALEAVERYGTLTEAATALGVPRGTLEHRHRVAKMWQAAPEGQRAAILHSGLSVGTAKAGWRKIKNEDGTSDSVYWRAEDQSHSPDGILDAIRDGLDTIAPALPVAPQQHRLRSVPCSPWRICTWGF